MAQHTYRVNWPIKGLVEKGRILRIGETIRLDEPAAKRCLEVGSLTLIEEPPTISKPPVEQPKVPDVQPVEDVSSRRRGKRK